uniref:Uncharacterized protein LOC114332611 n=1 Tax=Diabrotica virgifera virgifera TaxID=50390 RepID=A0A6P7FTU8_DIAVI
MRRKIATWVSTMKDLSNIAYGMKSASNDLEHVVKELKDIYKCNVHILHDSVNQFKALYFSTDFMRRAIKSWPEFVSVDGTYKLLNLGFTVFIMLVEDSNGQSEIAAVALTAHEDKETFSWFMNIFKEENSICENQIKCFMGDKDLLQRNVIKEIFPQAQVYICLFHTLKTMKREMCKEKMNLTNQERMKTLELLQNLVYSGSEEEYDRNYQLLQETASQLVINYYNKNWHDIKHEWTVYSMCHGNLLNRTNNRLEAINGKLKQVIEKNSSFPHNNDVRIMF